jgi:hypothetical protein
LVDSWIGGDWIEGQIEPSQAVPLVPNNPLIH